MAFPAHLVTCFPRLRVVLKPIYASRAYSLLRRIYSYALRFSIPQIQAFLSLDKLNPIEESGGFSSFTGIKLSRYFIFELPYSLGRTIRGTCYLSCENDAFLQGLVNQKYQSFNLQDFSRLISNVYSEELTLSVSDKIPITKGSSLGSLPLWAMNYPWEPHSPFDKLAHYPSAVLTNRVSHLNSTLGQDTFLDSDSFGMSHAIQFAALLSSISEKGFQPNRDLPCVYILRSADQWRWVMSGSGNHRAYILNHLEYPTLPAQIIGVVNRAELHHLPLVREGVFSLPVAQYIFDSVFTGSNSLRGIM